jgi:hypothetical protein
MICQVSKARRGRTADCGVDLARIVEALGSEDRAAQ